MIPHAVQEPTSKSEKNDIPYEDYGRLANIKWTDQLLLNRPLKVVLAFLLTAVVAPILIYQLLFYPSLDLPPADGFSFGSCLVPRGSRVLCGNTNRPASECHSQCCYDLDNNVCFHRYPSRFSYIMDFNWAEEINLKPRVATVPYGSQNSFTSVRLSIDEISSTHLSIEFYNPAEKSLLGRRLESKDYSYEVSSPELNIVVTGKQGVIFDTIRGPLIASNDIWEIAFRLTNETMYGLGEIPIKSDTAKVIYNHNGGFSGIPLIFAKFNGSYHGLLIDVVEPTELFFGQENQVSVRSITSSGLKFQLFIGPTPADVMRDVVQLLESKKQLHYWMLGAHVCSETADTPADALAKLNTFINTTATQGMPFESHCGIKSVVFENECDTEQMTHVQDGASAIKNAGKRFVPHVSPYIMFESANDTIESENGTDTKTAEDEETCFNFVENYKDHMLQNSQSDRLYKGSIGNQSVVYPYYENATPEFMDKLWRFETEFHGVVLENNWPLDESWTNVNETQMYLPYFNENFEIAFNNTPQWNATRGDGQKYLYNHNEYGNNFVKAFSKLTDVPTWTTSQWKNGDVIINRQNISTSWTNLQRELTEAALGGVSGHWLWSSPICGDADNFNIETQSSLCVKWYMAATYFPMIKIHSKNILRDPLAFIGTNRILIIKALNNRLSLLPYFYTTLQDGPLLRPMFFQYPSSEALKDLTSQFNVGDDLLIVPNLQPSQTHVHIWMPPGTWYEIWSGLKLDGKEGEAVTMTTTEADFLTLIRGGSIVTMQKDVKLTAETTRLQSDFSVTIAIGCETVNISDEATPKNETKCHSQGHIYMTPNITIVFEANLEELKITAQGTDFEIMCNASKAEWAHKVTEIYVFGLDDNVNNYDHHKYINADINLCELKSKREIIYLFGN